MLYLDKKNRITYYMVSKNTQKLMPLKIKIIRLSFLYFSRIHFKYWLVLYLFFHICSKINWLRLNQYADLNKVKIIFLEIKMYYLKFFLYWFVYCCLPKIEDIQFRLKYKVSYHANFVLTGGLFKLPFLPELEVFFLEYQLGLYWFWKLQLDFLILGNRLTKRVDYLNIFHYYRLPYYI